MLPTILLTVMTLTLFSCATVVHAPDDVDRPATVHLAHYDRYHSSLVIPGEGVATEYTFGDLDLFARYDQSFWPAIKGMTFPTQGVLGRRVVAWTDGDLETLREALDNDDTCNRVSTVEVARADLEELQDELDDAFERALDTKIENEAIGLTFVEYASCYTLLNNCNHELSRWLEQLGCRVTGVRALAQFEVKASTLRRTRSAPAVASVSSSRTAAP